MEIIKIYLQDLSGLCVLGCQFTVSLLGSCAKWETSRKSDNVQVTIRPGNTLGSKGKGRSQPGLQTRASEDPWK